MNVIEFGWKTTVATILALVGQLIIGVAVTATFGDIQEGAPGLSEVLFPMLMGTAITVMALYFPTRYSNLQGRRLLLAVFLAVFGINVFLTQTEAVIFLAITPKQILVTSIQQTLVAALFALVVVKFFADTNRKNGQIEATASGFTIRRWTGRVVLASISYLVLYLVAGMMIFPFVEDFYVSQDFSGGPWLMPLGLVRGALYVGFAALLLRSIRAPRWQVSLAMAFMFPILAGVAGLLIPNPLMPEAVRFWHALEIGGSNFIFGYLVGHLFWNSGNGQASAPDQS